MNDLQKKSLELLRLFLDICDKWKIKYFLVCGSALGAVKYGGFIPWDDDIDVGLPREDYQRFLQIAQAELPEWCFLQNYQTDSAFPHTFSKLRNSNTAFIEKGTARLPINHGIYMDIFPLDGYPDGWFEKKVFKLRRKLYSWLRFSALDDTSSRKVVIRNRILRMLGAHKRTAKAVQKTEKLYQKYSLANSFLWCNYGNWQGELEYAPQWHYGNGTWAEFEGLKVRVPENYDAYLTQKYGDWRTDPPEEKQKTHHEGIVIDVDKSYTFYIQSE